MGDTTRVEAANSLSLEAFHHEYCQSAFDMIWGSNLELSVEDSSSISAPDFLACFQLLRFTSSHAYKASSLGWSKSEKRKEMKLPDMKYLLLKRPSAGAAKDSEVSADTFVGFLSFMVTVEDAFEVVYCYEIHLRPDAQGQGLGPKLMHALETIGRAVGLEMAMLTVFTSNVVADRMYRRLGYELHDQEPMPAPKRLRNRNTERPKPSYIILAKVLR